jgi:hypothetical protein
LSAGGAFWIRPRISILQNIALLQQFHSAPTTMAALAAYGICQTGCNAACSASAGFVAGAFTLGAGAQPALVACSAAQGACMAGCAATTGTAAAAAAAMAPFALLAAPFFVLAGFAAFGSRGGNYSAQPMNQ